MVQKRLIPCLLLHKGGLYKTQRFKKPRYIGDPVNAIKIFNEKEVDELMFIDIDATSSNYDPNYDLIENIASECFMPLCYGGGVKSIEQMKKIYSLGVEKISLSSTAVYSPELLTEAVSIFGSQSVIVTIDVKKDFWGRKKIYTHNGRKNTKLDVIDFLVKMENLGVGEIIINSIDFDGVMGGFDLELIKEAKDSIGVPLIALGGAGSLKHIKEVFTYSKADAVAAGSLFIYQGPLRGVLINYPSQEEILILSNNE